MRFFIYLILTILLFGCAKKPAEEVDEAIDIAKTYLSQNECQKAIDVLLDVGLQPNNAYYIEQLASAYSCRAGFSEVTFLSGDVTTIDTSSSTSLFPSLSKLSLSHEAEADSDEYTDILTAINLLLASTSQSTRNSTFGNRKAGDLGMQAIILSIVQLGKFLNLYGNVDTNGEKGKGAANVEEQGATASTCFIKYTAANAITILTSQSGTPMCKGTGADVGHPDLSLSGASLATTKRRMCEGFVLLTNVIDILNNISVPSSSAFSNIAEAKTAVNSIKSDILLLQPSLSTLLAITDQASCETYVASSTGFDDLQVAYAGIFELGLP